MARTPLYETHAELGATFTEFAGYEMPVHYGSIKEEHAFVREKAGLFDVSHMSNLWVRGDDAVNQVLPKSISDLAEGRGRYSTILHPDGTILDDTILFRQDDALYVIPNAGMNAVVAKHFAARGASVDDVTAETGILALQGPLAREILSRASGDAAPKFHRMVTMDVGGVSCMVSGTGYTGEKGVELYVPAKDVKRVWDHLMATGADDIRPIGLGARDTLRLEKGYCLAGHEFAGGRTPVEANLGFVMDWEHTFEAKGPLQAQTEHDVLVGLVQAKGVPREGYAVLKDGQQIGIVTSGTLSPTLGTGIALAYVRGAAIGDEVQVQVRQRTMDATIVKTPFV